MWHDSTVHMNFAIGHLNGLSALNTQKEYFVQDMSLCLSFRAFGVKTVTVFTSTINVRLNM